MSDDQTPAAGEPEDFEAAGSQLCFSMAARDLGRRHLSAPRAIAALAGAPGGARRGFRNGFEPDHQGYPG